MKNKHGHEGCVMMVNQAGQVVAYDHIGPMEVIDLVEDGCAQLESDPGDCHDKGELGYIATHTWTVTRECKACGRHWTFCTDTPEGWPVGYSTADQTTDS